MPKVLGTEQDIQASIRTPNPSTGTRIGSSTASALLSLSRNANTATSVSASRQNDAAAGKFLASALDRTESIDTPAEQKKFRQEVVKQASSRFGVAVGKTIVTQFDSLAGVTETFEGGVTVRTNRFTGEKTTSTPLSAADLTSAEDIATVEVSMPNASAIGTDLANAALETGTVGNVDDINSWMRTAAGAVQRIQNTFNTVESMFDPTAREDSKSKLANLAASEITNVLSDMRDNTTIQNMYAMPGGAKMVTQLVNSSVNDLYDAIGPVGFDSMGVSRSDFQAMVGLNSESLLEYYRGLGTVNETDLFNKTVLANNISREQSFQAMLADANPEMRNFLLNSEALGKVALAMTTIDTMSTQIASDPANSLNNVRESFIGLMGQGSQIGSDMEVIRQLKVDSIDAALAGVKRLPGIMKSGPDGIEIAKTWVEWQEVELVDKLGEKAVKSLKNDIAVIDNAMKANLASRKLTPEQANEGADALQTIVGNKGIARRTLDFLKGQVVTLFEDTSGAELAKEEDKE